MQDSLLHWWIVLMIVLCTWLYFVCFTTAKVFIVRLWVLWNSVCYSKNEVLQDLGFSSDSPASVGGWCKVINSIVSKALTAFMARTLGSTHQWMSCITLNNKVWEWVGSSLLDKKIWWDKIFVYLNTILYIFIII